MRVRPQAKSAAAWLAGVIVVSSPGSAGAAEIRGRIVDAISGRPVAGAVVELSVRRVHEDARGVAHLSSARDAIPHAVALGSSQGSFELSVTAEGAWVGLLVIHADGYEQSYETMAPIATGVERELVVALVRETLCAADRELLEARRLARLDELRREPDATAVARALAFRGVDLPRGGRSSDAEYPTPDEVFVVELGSARFTGYVALDDLVAGTVAAEMGDGFPAAALRAQAIAARTYALERHERTGVANGGQAYASQFAPQGKSAVAAMQTHAQLALAGGEPITAFYLARCNGDRTLDSEDGLSGTTTCIVGGLGVGALSYVRSRPCSGHVSCALTTEPCCTVAIDGDVQHLYGHGVGLCQRGAEELACRDGLDADEIVHGYYSDVSIANPPALALGTRVIATTALNTRAAPCTSPPLAVPAGSLGTVVSQSTAALCSALGNCRGQPGSAWRWRRVDWDDGPVERWSVEDYLLPVPAGACGAAQSCPGGVCAPRETCDLACQRCRGGACESRCGTPQSDGDAPVLNDVLFLLQSAVGFRDCELCVCDVTGDSKVGVSDALLLLRIVTGAGGDVACPAGG